MNVVGNPKSRGFRLSQALANQVVRKGVCGDFILCGLSPPVSTGAQVYLLNARDRTAITKSPVMVLRISEYRLNKTYTLDRKKAFTPDLVK